MKVEWPDDTKAEPSVPDMMTGTLFKAKNTSHLYMRTNLRTPSVAGAVVSLSSGEALSAEGWRGHGVEIVEAKVVVL